MDVRDSVKNSCTPIIIYGKSVEHIRGSGRWGRVIVGGVTIFF